MRCCCRPGSSSSNSTNGGDGCCYFCCSSRNCGSCRAPLAALCRRYQLWRRGLALLSLALFISLVVPDAPISRLLLSEDTERHRLLSENEQRLQRSQRFLERYRASGPPERVVTRDDDSSDSAAEVGVTVLTMARGRRMAKGAAAAASYRTQYLTQSVAVLLQLLNDSSLRRSYSLQVCNVDDRPELFAEAQELEGLLPSFRRYGEGRPKPPKVVWEKLKADYVYCLQQTLARGARYALLVEDDAVAHAQLFRVLEHVLDRVVEKKKKKEEEGDGEEREGPASQDSGRPVAYLKLYHPQRLLGYVSLEVERLTELVALSLTLGALLTLLTRCQRARHGRGWSGGGGDREAGGSRSPLLLAWAGWAVVVAMLALAAGRTNLLELRRLSPQLYQVTPTPSCCIPAVLWTRHGALGVSRYLLNVTCTALRSTDIRMDEFRETTGARGLLVQPNLFSHIGLLSTLRTKEVSPLIVE